MDHPFLTNRKELLRLRDDLARVERIAVVARMETTDHALVQQRRDSMVADPELRLVLSAVGWELGLLLRGGEPFEALRATYEAAWTAFVLEATPLPEAFASELRALGETLAAREKELASIEDRGDTSSESDYSDADTDSEEEDSEEEEEDDARRPPSRRQRIE